MALSFIQFLHPGKEHKPKRKEKHIDWNETTNSHGRKFIEINGKYLDKNEKIEGTLWVWTEWEPESTLIKTLDQKNSQHPKYLWSPYWADKNEYGKLHNTDPFIFDGFYYTDCQQNSSRKMKHLSDGSIIAFGSNRGNEWILDTLFVVNRSTSHDANNYKNKLDNVIPRGYEEITLRPTYSEVLEKGEIKSRTFYSGATYDDNLNGIYSFFPCMNAGENIGFKRPIIKLSHEYFSDKLNQKFKATEFENNDSGKQQIFEIWQKIREQVEKQGLKIGIYAEMPKKKYSPQKV